MRWKLLRVMFIAVSLPCVGQTKVSNTPPSYEGQKVGSVEIAVNPHLNTEQYRPLIVQQAGEPFSNQKVQQSIDALKRTDAFSRVDLKIEPEPAGLKLTFILEPAYYMGMLRFPGALKRFSYARLLQVVNLQDQTVFQQSQIQASETALVKFFQGYGYFLAKVRTDVKLDDHNQLAHLTFHVTLGPHAHIGKVEVRGATPEEDRKLKNVLGSWRARFTGGLVKQGKPYSPKRIQTATALLKRKLSQQHYPDNKIVVNPPEYHPETNLADVAFNVDTGPVIDIRVTGASLTWIPFQSGRRKKKLIAIYDEGSVDPDVIEESRRNLTDYFQRKGFFNVKVSTNSQQQNKATVLTFHIDTGRKYSVKNIDFNGNHYLGSGDLLAHVQVKKKRFLFGHGLYSEKLLQNSAKGLEGFYQDNGFEDVKVTPHAVERSDAIYISFDIAEGDRTAVASLRVEGNKSIPLDELLFHKRGFELKEGKPYSPRRLANDRNHISAKYLDRGYLNSEVKTIVSRHPDDPHQVDVTYSIIENQQVRISHVVYMGYRHTRLSLIKQSANLVPEEPLSEGNLLQGESNLYDDGIFDWASVAPRKAITSQKEEEALVKVHEERRNSITYGIGFEISRRGGNVPSGTIGIPGLPTVGLPPGVEVQPSDETFASPRVSIQYTRLNLRGLAETGSVSLLLSRLDQRAIATYTDPHFRASSWQALTSLSFERTTENPLFEARLEDASLQFQRYMDQRKRYQLQLRYDFNHTTLSHLIVPELVLPSDRDVRLSYVSGTVIEDTRDKPLDAHRGVYSTIDFRIVPSAFGSSADFTRLFSQYAFYKRLHGMVFANSLRFGIAIPFAGSDVPTSERFFAGGGTTLRGFAIDQAGPIRYVPFCQGNSTTDCPTVAIPIGGNQLFIINSELRYPIPIMSNLGGVVFYDGGNVYNDMLHTFVDQYTNTIGIGLRYNTPIGPVRFDVGQNLDPVKGIRSTQFFITLGQAF